jgi:hypothetical protein
MNISLFRLNFARLIPKCVMLNVRNWKNKSLAIRWQRTHSVDFPVPAKNYHPCQGRSNLGGAKGVPSSSLIGYNWPWSKLMTGALKPRACSTRPCKVEAPVLWAASVKPSWRWEGLKSDVAANRGPFGVPNSILKCGTLLLVNYLSLYIYMLCSVHPLIHGIFLFLGSFYFSFLTQIWI